MKRLTKIALFIIILNCNVCGAETGPQAKLFKDLSEKAKSITNESTTNDVTQILGKPESKSLLFGTSWVNRPHLSEDDLKATRWTYMATQDKVAQYNFEVTFHAKNGCKVFFSRSRVKSSEEIKAERIKARERIANNHVKKTLTGTVVDPTPMLAGGRLLFFVKPYGGLNTPNVVRPVRIFTNEPDLVSGTPTIGSEVIITHYLNYDYFVFNGPGNNYLESIKFTKK